MLFNDFLAQDAPVLHVEHKLLYPLQVATGGNSAGLGTIAESGSPGCLPTVAIRLVPPEDCSLTVVAYGYQAELARRVLERLAIEQELFTELLVPAQLSPVDWAPLERSVTATGGLLTVEEGTRGWSWGTEVAAELGSRLFGRLRRAPSVLASANDVIPSAADREAEMLVGERQIEEAVSEAAA
jgi:pyruvate/2-oxoglutarate/acetoin dehydrogenase E1 component